MRWQSVEGANVAEHQDTYYEAKGLNKSVTIYVISFNLQMLILIIVSIV